MSNLDPIGTQGLPERAPVSDLELALAGGDDFAARMKQIAAAKAEADAAVQALNLGKGVKAAHLDAQQTVATAVAESNALKSQAEAALTAAQSQAANTISDANANAASIVADAQAKAAEAKADAAKAMQDADAYAAQKMTDADAVHTAALQHQQSAQRSQMEADGLVVNHKAALAAAEAAKALAEKTRAQLQDQIDRLNGILREIAG